MPPAKDKKSKNKLLKIDVSSGSDSDGSEHELSYYTKDKVKLMKEVLKLIKPKKIKSMAPECIKDLDIVEINSMLLEELLGISNKRLQYIFNGENVDRETSSSESEEEKQPVDVISLDDISDDDDIELCISQNEKASLEPGSSEKNKKHKSHKIKTEAMDTTIKSEKPEKSKKDKKKSKKASEPKTRFEDLKETDRDKLMSVLELLELQARARAIRSQLAIETEKKKENESQQNTNVKEEEGSDSDAVIIETPEHKEIVITSSESEEESCSKVPQTGVEQNSSVSELFTHLQSAASDSASPQKKQKSHASQEQDHFNKMKQQNKEVDLTIHLVDEEKIENVEMQKNKENAKSDNKKRKEKLLAKIQKIKLVRNRTAINSKLTTEISNINEKNKSDDNKCNEELTVAPQIENSETPSTSKEVNHAKVVTDSAKGFGIQSNNSQDNIEFTNNLVKEKQNSSNNKDVESDDSVIKLKESSPKGIHKEVNVNYCDNDEIVINLDEDEMDGIENDCE